MSKNEQPTEEELGIIIIIIDRSIADAVQKRHAQMRVLHAVCELPIN